MFLNIGLQTGVLLRTVVDTVNGELTDTRTRQATHDTLTATRLTTSPAGSSVPSLPSLSERMYTALLQSWRCPVDPG
jgi:hypothetical protein